MKTTFSLATRFGISILLLVAAGLIRQAGRAVLGEPMEAALGVIVVVGFAGCFAWAWFRAKKETPASKESHD